MPENLHEIREVARNGKKLTLWCASSIFCEIRTFYFDDPIVNGYIYFPLLKNIFLPLFLKLAVNTIPEYNEASVHYSRAVRDLLNEEIPESYTGRRGPML